MTSTIKRGCFLTENRRTSLILAWLAVIVCFGNFSMVVL